MRQSFLVLATLFVSLSTSETASAARFSGGICASQGSWLQDAMKQSRLIVAALETLKDDPNCKLLTGALASLPKGEMNEHDAEGSSSFAYTYRELSALNDYLNPARLKAGMSSDEFRKAVFESMFRKSYDSIKELNTQISPTYTEGQREVVRNVSNRLQGFLNKTKQVAKMSMATTQAVLNVLPQSQRCLHNKPSASAAIFGALAHSTAALVSGGEMTGIGEFTSALMNYSRDTNYVKSLKPLEYEEFRNSVSCLVESTSESYCAIQDAEDTLEALKVNGGKRAFNLMDILEQSASDPVASPLAGLVIYMRDIPVVQNWLQKVLMGLAPRTAWQGQGKNENWASYLGFIQSINSLQANFTDKEQQYRQSTNGKDRMTKLGQVREIFDDTTSVLRKSRGGSVNFFTRTKTESQIPFFLIGLEIPADFNSNTNDFDNFWIKWTREGINGFDNPDRLLQRIRDNLWQLMSDAQKEANALFASRMLNDPHNLVTEAMNGSGLSAYQAFQNQRVYYTNLITKLDRASKELQSNPREAQRARLMRAHIPFLKDSVDRITKVIAALDSVAEIEVDGGSNSALQSEKIMNAIYEAGNMLVSWDSFFGSRMQTALQADLSDTLWRKTPFTERQQQYLMSTGPEIVGKLSGFFANNPVTERTDLNAAKVAHITNLTAVEEQFAKVLFGEILALNCKLEGGYACEVKNANYDPVREGYTGGRIRAMNDMLITTRKGNGFYQRYLRWMYKPTDDAVAFVQTRAKLCVQALGFKSREAYKEICKGAVLESEFSDRADSVGLNLSFDDQLTKIATVENDSRPQRIDRARSLGVCSLRSYLRKNHVYFMYRDYNN